MLLSNENQPMIRGNAVALDPRTNGVDRTAGEFGNFVGSDVLDDLTVSSHRSVMHYALRERKHLLHNGLHYAQHMADAAERLRIARMRAGFSTGKEAAEAMGFPVSTYLAHENGSRGYPSKKAFTYARKFKVREQWLLYGVGPGPGETDDPKAEVVHIAERLPPLKLAEALGYLRALANSKGE